jgi:hypothetical protein
MRCLPGNLCVEDIAKVELQFRRAREGFLAFFGMTDLKHKESLDAVVIRYAYHQIDDLKGRHAKSGSNGDETKRQH